MSKILKKKQVVYSLKVKNSGFIKGGESGNKGFRRYFYTNSYIGEMEKR